MKRSGKTYRKWKTATAWITAVSLAAAAPCSAYAAPSTAYSEEVWARLRDNVMEYDELQLLVEEYSPYYLNNLSTYTDTKSDDNAKDLRQSRLDSAEDLDSSADDMDSSAEDIMSVMEEMTDAGLSGGGMASGYAAMKKAAANLRVNAVRTAQTADSSYEDAEVRSLQLQIKQKALVRQTEQLFASYHMANKAIPVLEASLARAQRNEAAVQGKIAAGLSVASDLYTSQNSIKQLESSLASSRANVESIRRSLLLNTGWQVTDLPEIMDVPEPDTAAAAAFSPDTDAQAALDNNLTLKLYRQQLSNMTSGSTDYNNMVRTIGVQEQTVRSTLKQKYDAIREDQLSLSQAEAALQTENHNLLAAQAKLTAGMITQNQFLEQQEKTTSAQVDRDIASITLQQDIESYKWALEGVI